MINTHSLVQLKENPTIIGVVKGTYRSDDAVTAWVKWDCGVFETRNVKELREIGKFYPAQGG